MKFPRSAGILLHPTSLPGEYGIGDLGQKAFEFVDFLAAARQTYWQVLPLTPTGYGDSPYSSFSAFAGNTLLISPEKLSEDGLLAAEDLETRPEFEDGTADYGGVYEWKGGLLPKAYENLSKSPNDRLHAEFDAFIEENANWLHDYALYRAIKASRDHKAWFEWDEPLKLREEGAIAMIADELKTAVRAEKFSQFLFFRQWSALKQYAAERGVKIVGDAPIFVALDSSDVWCNQDKFKLNEDGTSKVVAGVPPDFFSKTGQLWGSPVYDWNAMREDGFRWWIDRIRQTLKTVDIVRIDHFRGFAGVWEVPGDHETAEHGEWVDAPGEEIFAAMQAELGELPFWAEDLGVITPDVEHLRDSFGLPGMRILQFAFGGDARNHALPHNYIQNCVAYTGTHDNDTVVGWWKAIAGKKGELSGQQKFCLKYLNTDGAEIHWDMVRAAWSSVADIAVAPLQDLLGLDNSARMNLPASNGGNWKWRYRDGDITPEITDRLREMTETYAREAPPLNGENGE